MPDEEPIEGHERAAMMMGMIPARNEQGNGWVIDVDDVEDPDAPGAEEAALAITMYDPSAVDEVGGKLMYAKVVTLYLSEWNTMSLINDLFLYGGLDPEEWYAARHTHDEEGGDDGIGT